MRILLSIIILCSMFFLNADILNVPASYHYISLAILAATDGDTILVQPGNYAGVIDFEGKEITLTSTYIFTGNEADIHHTRLTGNYSDTSLISFTTNETESSIINGFTITNSGAPAQGGAVFCDGTSPTLTNLRFVDNQATSGGALFTNAASPHLAGCSFDGNSATEFGGAIYLEESQLYMDDCEILNSVCDGGGNLGRGGALFVSNSTIDLDYCHFKDNSALVHAGAVYLSYGSANIDHTIFSGNSGGGNVGAVYFYNSDDLVVSNCTFSNNSGTNAGALRFYSAENPETPPLVINTICRGSSPLEIFFSSDNSVDEIVLANCNIEGLEDGIETNGTATVTWLETNIDEDPEYISPEHDHFYLDAESPCIDAGLDFFEFEGTTYLDIDDYWGTAPDMGACESDVDDQVPLAMFSYDTDSGDLPLEVNFYDESLGNAVSWEWDFDNDGTIDSEEQNPSYIYNVDGIYSVSLRIITENHISDKLMVDAIEVTVPSANDEDLPSVITALETYPNPFNPTTKIRFTLTEDDDISLNLYNTKGQFIKNVISGYYSSGEHFVNLTGDNLSSGIYMLRLSVSAENRLLKILLLK